LHHLTELPGKVREKQKADSEKRRSYRLLKQEIQSFYRAFSRKKSNALDGFGLQKYRNRIGWSDETVTRQKNYFLFGT
jgi:hypothetical protein